MIVPLALRLSAKYALLGSTFAKDRVFDSAISAVNDLIGEDAKPLIVISTDEQTYNPTHFDINGGSSRQVDIVLDIAVASAVDAGNGEYAVVIPHTDAGTEMSVNLITRQAVRALFEPNSGGEWGRMFRLIAQQATRVMIRRGAGSEKGVRFAAGQAVISTQPLFEPAFGIEPVGVWADFLALISIDENLSALAPMIRAVLVGDVVPDWALAASILGISNEAGRGIGVLPLSGAEADPVLQATIQPDGWIGDQEAVNLNAPIANE